jgi:RNA polymerase sigma factor (sigma-70 family)
MNDSQQLLADYARTGSEAAFRQIVERYVDLVHSAALRLVDGDAHRAQDVAQAVFLDLTRMARSLPADVMLGGWLHRHTCFVAANTMRAERRRMARERRAFEMNPPEECSPEQFAELAPVLDAAVNELNETDRKAVLLRFFEQQDFRAVGESLGTNEDAARKRVSRALEKLQDMLTRRGITLSTAALASVLSAQAVTAAPAGLSLTISTAALASAGAATSSLTVLKLMGMTKLKAAAVGAIVVAAGLSFPYLASRQENARLAAENRSLQQQLAGLEQAVAENQRLSNLLAGTKSIPVVTTSSGPSPELLRLRGEVTRLKQETASVAQARANAPSMLASVASDPEMWKSLRNQQKLALSAIYKDLGRKLKLSPEQTEKLNDMLADNVMENIEHITAALRAGKTAAESEPLFAQQEAAFQQKLGELLGAENVGAYQDYTRNLLSHISAQQFKSLMDGSPIEKDSRARQLYQALQEEREKVLASAGLSADFQLVPTLNFRNIAFEDVGERNLALLDSLYARVAERAAAFLPPEDLKKFGEFRSNAINGNRVALTMNRKMMAPSGR